MSDRIEPGCLLALTEEQAEIVQAIADGQIKKYEWPGRWCAFVEGDEIVVRDVESGRTERVPLTVPRRSTTRPASVMRYRVRYLHQATGEVTRFYPMSKTTQ